MKIKVGVIFGGKSVEHEISIISALQAVNNINKNKYDIVPIYLTKDNEMYVGDLIKDIENYRDIDKLLKNSTKVIMMNNKDRVELYKYPFKKLSNNYYDYIDVAFPIVHGTNVEDGTLQGYLKHLGIPFVGCDVTSSAIGMNKYITKVILKDNDIPVLDSLVVNTYQYIEDNKNILKEIKKKFKYPIIIKPINLGSSVGITIANNDEETESALEHAFNFARELLIEPSITNLKEINCSVVGDLEECSPSVCEEPVRGTDKILSYEDKYLSGSKNSKGMASLDRKIPADISKKQEKLIQEYAIKTFKALGCNGVVRIDFLINLDDDSIYVNEINTIPGSLSFYLWDATDLKYKDLLTKLIDLSLKREREENNISYKFDTNILENFNGSNKNGKL